MKGTFFSADFIKDESDNLRLLELNTDTAAGQSSSALLDFTSLYQTLVDNNLNTLDIIYKSIHQHIVDRIESTYNQTIPTLTINLHLENPNSVYPTTITETGNNFILRLVYDENAIFDSTYIKNRFNTFSLFTNNNDSSEVVSFAYKDADGNVTKSIDDTFINSVNSNEPDVIIKSNLKGGLQSHKFSKIGVDSQTTTERLDGLIGELDNDTIVEQYHLGSSSIVNNKIVSIRGYYVVYGGNLDVLSLGTTQSPSYFEKPTTIDLQSGGSLSTTTYDNPVHKKHYYEFATNAILSSDDGGLIEDHTVILSDGVDKTLSTIQVNDVLKSFRIEGLSLDETNSANWEMTGSTFPSGSTETTASVTAVNTSEPKNNVIVSIKSPNDNEIFTGVNKKFLTYNTSTDITKFVSVINLDPSVNKLVNIDNSLVDITSIDYVVTEDTIELVTLDVEPNDNYVIGDTGIVSSPIITHNKFLIPQDCFIGGTRVTLSNNEYKNIEDIVVGDEVLSFNEESGEVESKKVLSLNNPIHDDLVKYVFSNGKTLTSTYDHPYYVKGKGLASYDNYKTNLVYDLSVDVQKIEVGDIVSDLDLNEITIESIEELPRVDTQTYIIHVEDNNNFFAEDILVHNKQE